MKISEAPGSPPGSPAGSVVWEEVKHILLVSLWFGLMGFAGHLAEELSKTDWGLWTEVASYTVAGLLWLLKRWRTDTQGTRKLNS